MAPRCRHIMPNGLQCRGYALRDGDLCYFHTRQLIAAQKPVTSMDSIEIPLLEDRCAVQATLTQVLRAVVNKTIDRPRASILLYGLQLSLQSVDHFPFSLSYGTVTALTKTGDGEELVADPDDEDEDEYEDEDEDDEEEEDLDSAESGDDSGSEEAEHSDGDSDEENAGDDNGDKDDEDDESAGESTEELIAGQKLLQSVSNALAVGDMRLAARLLEKSAP